MAVKIFKNKRCARGNYINLSENKQDAEIIMDSKEGTKYYLSDLISCAINKNWQNPQFFVASDPHSEESVFREREEICPEQLAGKLRRKIEASPIG
jgi:hypothetical protein